MYTENTTQNRTGIKKEVAAEITSQMREVEVEVEADAEKESHHRLHQLIQSCILVFSEEDPADVESIIKAAAGMFTLEWIRDAVNETIRRNDRFLRAVMEILDMWKVQGHTVSTGKRMAGFARVTGTGSH